MSLTRKEFEDLAEIIATIRMVEPGAIVSAYVEERLINFCQVHGHNFNEKIFRERITDIQNKLNS